MSIGQNCRTMNVNQPMTLLGGITPAEFMKTYWQRKPLLVRQAIPGFNALLSRPALFDLAGQNGVESRLVMGANGGQRGWQMQRGPFKRRALPKLSERDWTLLVQGVDLHDDRVAALMHQFRFVPDARLDDVMTALTLTATTYFCCKPMASAVGALGGKRICLWCLTCH
jgi:50S ribosomal protein L16 3-hydroxylase